MVDNPNQEKADKVGREAPVPRGQHVIPRMHLQHFAGSRPPGQVWTFNKNSGAAWSAVPEETAKQTHFYSVEKDDGTYDTRIEEFLSECEGKAAPTYERLITGIPPPANSQEKADFALFAALLHVRTASMRRDAGEMIARFEQIHRYAYGAHEKAFAGLIKRVEKDQGKKLSQDEREKMREMLVDPSTYTVQVPKERTLFALGAADKLAPILFNMNWSLIGAAEGSFITSDNPLVRWVEPNTRHPIYGDHGFQNKTAEVTVPLTPQLLLLMAWRTDFPPLAVLLGDAVAYYNDMRAWFAEEYLYAHTDSEDLRRLAAKHKGSRVRMTTQGFGPDKFADVEIPRRWTKR